MNGKNDFSTDLEYSLENNSDEEIDGKYYKAFPHLIRIEKVIDKERQMQGIDKILIFENGHRINVDEKKRRKDYGDILLEEYSDYDKKKIGWLGREKHTDYITYIVEPSKKIYFLPFILLQKVWRENYMDWVTTYGRKFAQNEFYRTSNIAVPTIVLLEKIKEAINLNSQG